MRFIFATLVFCATLLGADPRNGLLAWRPSDPREGVIEYRLYLLATNATEWKFVRAISPTNTMVLDGEVNVVTQLTWDDPTNGVLSITAATESSESSRTPPVSGSVTPFPPAGFRLLISLTLEQKP